MLSANRVKILLILMLPLVLCLGAASGAYKIHWWKIPQIVWSKGDGYEVLIFVRFPRVILSAIVGSLLAISGATLQGIFRNPLADPGLVGVTAGASLGAALWIVLIGSGIFSIWGLPIAAFTGGILVTVLVYQIARTAGRVLTITLLLSGIAFNSIAGAGIGLMTFIADEEQLRSLTFWLLGSFGGATWQLILVSLPLSILGLLCLLPLSQLLNAMTLGESEAFHLGISVNRLKRRAVFGAALSVGAAVSAAGGIGFVGLVVPHLLRLVGGPDHRFVLPSSALAGAILLVFADTLARTAVSPMELPIGIITGALGGPFFLWLLIQHKRDILYI